MVREKESVSERLWYLDGIRGLMAFIVVVFHFILVFYPQLSYVEYVEKVWSGEHAFSWLANSPLSALYNGSVAVQYFFVLTGFLVSRSIIARKDDRLSDLLTKTANRYLRLMVVVAASTLFTYLTMVFGLQHHMQTVPLVPGKWLLEQACAFQPTVPHLLVNMFLKPFLKYCDYNDPLWTITFEFLGYIFCYVTALAAKNFKGRSIMVPKSRPLIEKRS